MFLTASALCGSHVLKSVLALVLSFPPLWVYLLPPSTFVRGWRSNTAVAVGAAVVGYRV